MTVQYVCMYCRRCTDYFVPYFSNQQQNMVQTILFIVDKTLRNPELILCEEVFLYQSQQC